MAKTPINPFLAMIIENPDDDAPRLVYADWLEEHGDTARAEFIRVQIEVEQAERKSKPRPDLAIQATDLLLQFRSEWLAEFPQGKRSQLHFERGFVELITCSIPDFLNGAAGVFRRAPVQKVVLINSSTYQLESILKRPYMARVREMVIRPGLDMLDTAPHFAACPHLRNLKRLVLTGTRVSDSGARALAASKTLANLEELVLMANPIGGRGRAALRRRFGDRVHF